MESVLDNARELWLSLELAEVAWGGFEVGGEVELIGDGRRRRYGASKPGNGDLSGGEWEGGARRRLTSGTGEEVGSVVRQRRSLLTPALRR